MTEAATETRPRGRRAMSAPEVPAAPAPSPAPQPINEIVGTDALPVRSARKPFGTRRERLENTPIPGFQCYWFNDIPGRIERAKEAGYAHVTNPDGSPVRKVVGVMEGGGPLHAYRMKIPMEWFLEDMAAKEKPRSEIDAQMRSGIRDGGYASEGRPGYTTSTVSAQMAPDGRQTFGTRDKS